MPVTGSGCTGKVMFWCTPASLHQTRLRVGIGRLVGLDVQSLAHLPLTFADFLQIDPRARHALDLIFFIDAPAAQMVRAGDHSRRQALGDPRVQHEVADLGVNFDQIAGANVAELRRVGRIHPQRILVRNLVEKFRSCPIACGSDSADEKSAAACRPRRARLLAIRRRGVYRGSKSSSPAFPSEAACAERWMWLR